MKREAIQRRSPRTKRWLLPAATIVVGITAVAMFLIVWLDKAEAPSLSQPARLTTNERYTPAYKITATDLQALRWEDLDPAMAALDAKTSEIKRLTEIAGDTSNPPAVYLRALLLIAQRQPEQALAAFDILDPNTIPPRFLYAPYRLHQALGRDGANPYLHALRRAVTENRVPVLIKARLQARDGDLPGALTSYLRTDPASWANHDLDSLRRIANHQGLAADLSKLIAGALASGRVEPKLTPALQDIARQPSAPPDLSAFKRQLQRAVKAKTPEGMLAIESASKLLRDRKRFLRRDYRGLLDEHHQIEPMTLPTETALLLFLAAVELKEQLEVDRWGQELKRRHGQAEVRDWVKTMTASSR